MIEIKSLHDQVVLIVPERLGHPQQFIGYTITQAHELMMRLAEEIGSAQGFSDAMSGKVKTPTDCPNCKARNTTPRHVCKRSTPRTGR